MGAQLPPIPFVIVDPKTGQATGAFRDFLDLTLVPQVQNAPQILPTPAPLTNQHASLAATNIVTTKTKGLYLVGFYARVTIVDGVSSSLAVTLGWLETAQPLSQPFPALTADTVTTFQSALLLVLADNASNLTIQTTYASNTPAKMRYELYSTVQLLQVAP